MLAAVVVVVEEEEASAAVAVAVAAVAAAEEEDEEEELVASGTRLLVEMPAPDTAPPAAILPFGTIGIEVAGAAEEPSLLLDRIGGPAFPEDPRVGAYAETVIGEEILEEEEEEEEEDEDRGVIGDPLPVPALDITCTGKCGGVSPVML